MSLDAAVAVGGEVGTVAASEYLGVPAGGQLRVPRQSLLRLSGRTPKTGLACPFVLQWVLSRNPLQQGAGV